MLKKFRKHRKLIVMALALVMVLSFSGGVFANTSNGTEFQSLYDTVLGWITGLPAIIIALGIGFMGVVRAFQTGSFMWALGGLLIAALLFLLPGILTGLGGATIII